MLSRGGDVILTIDVEDNFFREELVRADDWFKYEKQAMENTEKTIRLLKDIGADATFFILGKTAERHPGIIQTIDNAGYEIASHGYAHLLVREMTPLDFEEDIRKSINVIQSVISKQVKGFRARSFSVTRETVWALDILDKLGLAYDSSMTDSEFRYLQGSSAEFPSKIDNHHFYEFPINTELMLGEKIAISGGVLMRILPFFIYFRLLRRSDSFNMCGIFYCHVWEFNKDQPSRNIGALQALAQSPITYTTEAKLRKLSRHYNLISIQEYLKNIKSSNK